MEIINDIEPSGKLPNKQKYSIEDFKAFSYIFNGKRDTDIKLFDDNKRFNKIDIVNLYNKIDGKLQTHSNVVINQFALNISLTKGIIKEYSNWEVFTKEDWEIGELTDTLVFEWDFFLNDDRFEFPQKHSLKIRIGSGVRPDELFKLMMSGNEDHDIMEASAEVVCKIDFINPYISNDLKNVVSNWYDSLTKNSEPNWLVKFVRNNRGKIAEFNIVLFIAAGLILIYSIVLNYFKSVKIESNANAVLTSFFFLMCVSVIVVYVCYKAGLYYGERIENKTIRKLRTNPIFTITRGDQNQIEENSLKNKKLISKLFLEVGFSVLVNIIMLLIGFVTDKIFHS